METWLLLVETKCKDETRHAEFNDWYDTVHIPDILNDSPGFKSATRYVTRDTEKTGGTRYLAVYEIETDNIRETMKAHSENVEAKKAMGRWTDSLEVIARRLCQVHNL